MDRAIKLSHSICTAVQFIHSSNDSFGCHRFPLAHRDIKVEFQDFIEALVN